MAFLRSSIDWRFAWSLRTCLSTSVVSFIALYFGATGSIRYVFASFVCIMVKDSTFGATLKNGVACLLASMTLTLSFYLIHVIK